MAGGLGNVECGRPRRGVDALGLVAVDEGAAPLGALVVPCADEALALNLHAHVVDRREDREHAIRPMLDQVFHTQIVRAIVLCVHVSSP